MQPLPHVYAVAATGAATGRLNATAENHPNLMIDAPREFDGPGDQWTPESLLVASVATCFILTFRAVAHVSNLQWTRLECAVEGTLERVEGVMQFTHFMTRARLTVPSGVEVVACEKALDKAEKRCLISNSLRARRELQMEIAHGEIAGTV